MCYLCLFVLQFSFLPLGIIFCSNSTDISRTSDSTKQNGFISLSPASIFGIVFGLVFTVLIIANSSANRDHWDNISDLSEEDSFDHLNSFMSVEDLSLRATGPLLSQKRRAKPLIATSFFRKPYRLKKDASQKSSTHRISYKSRTSKSFNRFNPFSSKGVSLRRGKNLITTSDTLAFKLAEVDSTDSDRFLRTLESDFLRSFSASLPDPSCTSANQVRSRCQIPSTASVHCECRTPAALRVLHLDSTKMSSSPSTLPDTDEFGVDVKSQIVRISSFPKALQSRATHWQSSRATYPLISSSAIASHGFRTNVTSYSSTENSLIIFPPLLSMASTKIHQDPHFRKCDRKVHFQVDKQKPTENYTVSSRSNSESVTDGNRFMSAHCRLSRN